MTEVCTSFIFYFFFFKSFFHVGAEFILKVIMVAHQAGAQPFVVRWLLFWKVWPRYHTTQPTAPHRTINCAMLTTTKAIVTLPCDISSSSTASCHYRAVAVTSPVSGALAGGWQAGSRWEISLSRRAERCGDMGKLQEFDITFTNNKVVYGPGESISGSVKIRTGSSLQYKGKQY